MSFQYWVTRVFRLCAIYLTSPSLTNLTSVDKNFTFSSQDNIIPVCLPPGDISLDGKNKNITSTSWHNWCFGILHLHLFVILLSFLFGLCSVHVPFFFISLQPVFSTAIPSHWGYYKRLVKSRLALGSPGWLFVCLIVTMPKMAQYTGKWLLTAP